MLELTNMKKEILLTAVIGVGLIFSACTQEGIGGEASIKGHVKHHDEPIPNAKVYIKYGANELPGTQASDYDDEIQASSGDGYFEFKNLERGSYYLYSIGYDSMIFDSVFGGISVQLKRGEDFDTAIPVTE